MSSDRKRVEIKEWRDQGYSLANVPLIKSQEEKVVEKGEKIG